ncbi:hypothetical protein NQ317_019083 [Molorchus minor]|uniref:Ion transport domain-containing protein n=1 Tax=Molorchus minor TaxID=1323400 RepID=A0ABQ9JM03_9CUCU|nr:hypothetical protein NQ317_019083 [Molorchus minor]
MVNLMKGVKKEIETLPLYANSDRSSSWQSEYKDQFLEDGLPPNEYEFIDCGTPPEEDAPNIYSAFERASSIRRADEPCEASIKTQLTEHISMISKRIDLLNDIESKSIEQEHLEKAFAEVSLSDINIAFLWAAFMKRWDLLEGFIGLGADLNYFEPKYGLGALHLSSFSGCIPGTQFLISQGCDVNAIYKCYAPIHCAAFGDSPDTAMILLNNGAKVQELTNGAYNSRESVLHCAVRANAVACVRLLTHEGGDVGQVEYSGMSPIHLAADLERIECLKALLEAKGANLNAKTKGKQLTALHLAAENGDVECVEILLERGADANVKNHMSQTPLHLAARAKAYDCVEMLLEKGNASPNVEDCDKRTALHTAVGKTATSCDIIELLINYGANINKKDQYGYTPLHVAALMQLSQCVEILIRNGADVTTKSKCGMTPLGIIKRKIPGSLEAIREKFDSSITLYHHPQSSSQEVDLRLDFRCILQNTHPKEISYLNTFVDEGEKEFLMHPLCSAFLYLKWQKIRKYYAARMIFCFVFVLSLSLYVLTALARNCFNHESNVNDTSRVIELCETKSMMGHLLRANPFVMSMQWFFLVGITCFEILRKICGLSGYSTVKQYFSYPENTLEWLVIVSVFVISFIYTGRTYMWQNHVGAFAVLFSWTNLMLMIGQLPLFGTYVAMYTRVLREFAKLLLAYSCMLIGFAISFCIMFPEAATFANPFVSLITIISMMSGELNLEIYADEDQDDPPLYLEVSAQITYTLFVLFVTIILMNLLVGIAVDDIQGLQKNAGVSKLVRQTKLISHIELALFNGYLPQYFLNLLHWTALVSPKAYKVVLNVKPLNQKEKRLPRDILKTAHAIAKKRKDEEKMDPGSSLDVKHDKLSTSLWQLQTNIEKRDEQIDMLRKEVKQLKNHFDSYQKTVEKLISAVLQRRRRHSNNVLAYWNVPAIGLLQKVLDFLLSLAYKIGDDGLSRPSYSRIDALTLRLTGSSGDYPRYVGTDSRIHPRPLSCTAKSKGNDSY